MDKKIIPVAVVVVNYKTKEYTRKALEALFNSTVSPARVILVDNASNDGSFEALAAAFPQVQTIANQNNLGFAKANNQAIRQFVQEPYVWLLNSDTETGQKSLEQLYEYIEAHPEVGALGPQIVYPTREFQSIGGFFPSITNVFTYLIPFTYFFPKRWRQKMKSIALYPQPIPQEGIDLDYVTGAASLLRKKALDEVGLLSEEHFMYFEETDLCFRLKKAGWKIRAIDTDPVMHVYGGSFKTKHDPRRIKLFLESLLLFTKRNYGGFRHHVITVEVALLGRISILLKKLKTLL